MEASPKVGLEALLTPDNCVVVMIDHQPFQLANVNSHEPTIVMNNVTALAKTAKALAWPESSSVIGRAVRGARRSLSSFATTQAQPVLYSHGRCSCYGSRKERASRASVQTRLTLA
jgi:hypothetical protein